MHSKARIVHKYSCLKSLLVNPFVGFQGSTDWVIPSIGQKNPQNQMLIMAIIHTTPVCSLSIIIAL